METLPSARRDLEFFPVQHQGQQYVLVRDSLGLVPEGKALGIPLYQLMTLLVGNTTVRDLQMALMRQQGGMLVGTDEIRGLLAHLEESYLLNSERFKNARGQIIADFTSKGTRPCSHGGKSYPDNPSELQGRLNEILNSRPAGREPDGKIAALVAPHIDLNVGYKGYASSYQMIRNTSPSRVILLGVGHQLQNALFSLTHKNFETPLGVTRADRKAISPLRDAGRNMVAADDFVHRSEHSIEFQLLFLQHLLKDHPFTIVPILCGSLQMGLPEYSRHAFQETAGPFLQCLKSMIQDPEQKTLLVAGVDFSHIGPKFGHDLPATAIQNRSESHDRNLLTHLAGLDPDRFWEESASVKDQYNVCGFSALASLLELLPPCQGEILHYETWHEEPTRSAVSFASLVFTSQE